MNKYAVNLACRAPSVAVSVFFCALSASVFAGDIKAKVYEVHDVTEVVVKNSGHLQLTQGDVESLRVEADEDSMASVRVDQTGGRLTLEQRGGSQGWNWFGHRNQKVLYILQVKDVHSLDLSGSSHGEIGALKTKNLSLQASGASHANFVDLKADKVDFNVSGASHLEVKNLAVSGLSFDVSGASHAEVEGGAETPTLKADVSGASHLELGNLQALNAEADVSGASHANLWVTSTLDASASGVSHLSYRGQPRLKKTDASGGSHIGAAKN